LLDSHRAERNIHTFLYLAAMRIVYLIALVLALSACSVPKVMNQSGRVTERGNATVGVSYMGNISQQTSTFLTDAIKGYAEGVSQGDTAVVNALLLGANAGLIAYSLDPIAFGPQIYLRFGIYDRLELGYTRSKGANMFSLHGQFLGFEKERNEKSTKRLFGSAGLQYSWNKFNLPSYFGNLQDKLGYGYSRKDLLVPITFSYSLGPNEAYGALGAGVVFGFHSIDYSFAPEKIVTKDGASLKAINHHKAFSSIGFFFNAKLGYKCIYLVPSIAIYYQDYGSYPLVNGSSVPMDGFTFVPALSLQINTLSAWWKN